MTEAILAVAAVVAMVATFRIGLAFGRVERDIATAQRDHFKVLLEQASTVKLHPRTTDQP